MDNPPAFPVVAENGLGHVSEGMLLRDWFAGQALSAALNVDTPPTTSPEQDADGIAKACYALADAMLAARASSAPVREMGE